MISLNDLVVPRMSAIPFACIAAICFLTAGPDGFSAEKEIYRTPPQEIVDIIDAPPAPLVAVDPTRECILIEQRPNLPSIAELAQPELRLAGRRINPATNGPSRPRLVTGLKVMQISDGTEQMIELPPEARIIRARWSPDGEKIAFSMAEESGVGLWVAEKDSGRSRQILGPRLNNAWGGSFHWLSGSDGLICLVVPANRGIAPQADAVPQGPVVRRSAGRKAPARTYQDLLESPHDEDLFEHYLSAQVAHITLDGGINTIGPAGMVIRAEPSPRGDYILVETIHRPFSYLVPASRFPRKIQIWSMDGQIVREIADLPLAEEVPTGFGAVRTGPRNVGWRGDQFAAIYWVEARDGGDPGRDADVRDQVMALAEPFDGEPRGLVSLSLRFSGIRWGYENVALVTEWWWKTRRTRTWLLAPDSADSIPQLLFDRSFEDRYGDPGRPAMWQSLAGTSILCTPDQGDTVFLVGEGASPEGSKPFIDRLNLKTGEKHRLWTSEGLFYERPLDLLENDGTRFISMRESVTEPPDYFYHDLSKSETRQLTFTPHPAPALAAARKELIHYERGDGVKLTATLYLPPGYTAGSGPLPMIFWAYPREYKSAAAAGQVRTSPFRFGRTSWSSPLLFLTQGYAVLDGPALPIIGEGDAEPNDSFVEQLVAGAQAAVDTVVERGVADKDKIAVGGHSYGAFMAAHLLAHSDLFRAGIARSGAYNRTLTPFGFQSEERTFWQAAEIYMTLSPFTHTHKVNEPLLLIHGDADSNSGTFPIQSERFFHALKGNGATARLVMLPHESHGYRARESVLHMLWEMNAWLERYVKNAPAR